MGYKLRSKSIVYLLLLAVVLTLAGCFSDSKEANNEIVSNENNSSLESSPGEMITTDVDNSSTKENDTTNIVDEETTDNSAENLEKSLKRFLSTAMKPVGTTMYIWGGGWNEEDTAAGPSATMIGLNPQWKIYADMQDKDYDYKLHRYEINNGLDCSGYVGWVMYNVLETEDGKEGYVYKASTMSKKFSELGLGDYIEKPTSFLAGDIVSMKGHVWICLGTCEDGSVLLVHASPPGVTVAGTPLEDGSESKAQQLAHEYMKGNYPDWYERYPDCNVKNTYIKDVTVFRWSSEIMKDISEYQMYSGEEILQKLSE